MSFIATQIVNQNENEELQKAFKSIDKNGDGTLSFDELVEGINIILFKLGFTIVYGDPVQATKAVQKILEAVDMNKSGWIDFSGIKKN